MAHITVTVIGDSLLARKTKKITIDTNDIGKIEDSGALQNGNSRITMKGKFLNDIYYVDETREQLNKLIAKHEKTGKVVKKKK